MKNLAKKMLASLVAVCMMLAIIPAIPAQTADAAEAIVYDFAAAYKSELGKNDGFGGKPGKWLNDDAGKAAVTTDTWRVVDIAVPAYNGNGSVSLVQDFGITLYGYDIATRDASAGIIFKVPENNAGWFEVKVNQLMMLQKESVIAKIELYSGNSATGTPMAEIGRSDVKVWTQSGDRTVENFEDVSLGKFNLTAGEYYVKISIDLTESGSKTNDLFVRNITLTPVAAPVIPPAEELEAVEYDFSGCYNDSWTKDDTFNKINAVLLKNGNNEDIVASAKGSGWFVKDAKAGSTGGATFNKNNGIFLVKDFGIAVHGYALATRDAEVGIVFSVPQGKTGKYEVNLNQLYYSQSNKSVEYIALYKGDSADESKKVAEVAIDSSKEADRVANNVIAVNADRLPANCKDVTLGAFTLDEGDYYLDVKLDVTADVGTNTVFLNKLTIDPVKESIVLPENSDVFGNCGAYIQKTDGGYYKATFLSGINSLEYEEVGFVVKAAAAGLEARINIQSFSSSTTHSRFSLCWPAVQLM